MDDFNNPYRSPEFPELHPLGLTEGGDPRRIGKAAQVPTVAILLVVHGVLMFLAACGLLWVSYYLPAKMAEQMKLQNQLQNKMNPKAPQLPPELMGDIMFYVYGGMAAVVFFVGIFNIVAGLRNYGYRSRVLGIISMISSLASVFFCYCLPFSIGLLIYGLIVYLSPEAERAFRWRADFPNAV